MPLAFLASGSRIEITMSELPDKWAGSIVHGGSGSCQQHKLGNCSTTTGAVGCRTEAREAPAATPTKKRMSSHLSRQPPLHPLRFQLVWW